MNQCGINDRCKGIMHAARAIALLALFALGGMQRTHAQIVVTLNLRNPVPSSLSVWANDPTIVQLVLSNVSATSYSNLRVSFTVRDVNSNKVVAHSKDADPGMPAFALPIRTTVTKLGTEIVKMSAVSIDQSIQRQSVATNSLPEGDYELCVRLLGPNGAEIPSTGVKCRSFGIVIPDPPTLLNPPHNSSLSETTPPTFTWTPVIRGAGTPVSYRLLIVPVFPGQSAKSAIEQNTPLLDKTIPTPTYFYAPSNPQFSLVPAATSFAWQIQALEAQGQPATRGMGRSEIFTFTLQQPGIKFAGKLPVITPPVITLLSPADNDTLTSIFWGYGKRLQFEWKYASPSSLGSWKYRIKLTKMLSGQTPPEAIAQNIAYYFPDVSPGAGAYLSWELKEGITRQDIPNLDGPFDYAWQVVLVDPSNDSPKAASAIRKLTYTGASAGTWKNTVVTGTLNYRFADQGEQASWPLANATVKLVVQYKAYEPNSKWLAATVFRFGNLIPGLDPIKQVKVSTPPSDWNTTVAVTTTDDKGNFGFAYIQTDSTGVAASGNKGTWRRILRLEIGNPHGTYYTGPETDLLIQPGQAKFLGTLTAQARSYGATVKVISDPAETKQQGVTKGSPLAGMVVYLLRQTRPMGLPSNEGARPFRNAGESGGVKWFPSGLMEIVAQETTGTAGTVSFTRAIRSAGPADFYYLYARSAGIGGYNYDCKTPVKFSFGWIDQAISSGEYEYKTTSKQLIAYPLKPLVKGIVKSEASGLPLSGALVVLSKLAGSAWSLEKWSLTDSSGAFAFDDLQAGVNRRLTVTRPGYSPAMKDIGILKLGQKWNDIVTLAPLAVVTGKIVNESGNGQSATVRVLGGESVEADPPFVLINFKRPPVSFKVAAPKGQATIIIDPTAYDPSLFPDTVSLNIQSLNVDVGMRVLKSKQHRLRVHVVEYFRLQLPGMNPTSIPGASVRVQDPGGNPILYPNGTPVQGTAGPAGEVEFVFPSSASQFVLAVSGPPEKDYISAMLPVDVPESAVMKEQMVKLRKAARIEGHVYVGDQHQPVPGAHVFLDAVTTGIPVEAWADADGAFVLRNVPPGKGLFRARKKASNLIGDQKELTVALSGMQNVNFKLSVYNNMDITHLLGFPIEVDTIREQGGAVSISGSFVDLGDFDNSQFQIGSLPVPGSLQFTGIEIVPGQYTSTVFGQQVPIALPKSLPVKTDKNFQPLRVYGKYNSTLGSSTGGIEIAADAAGLGVVRGPVRLDSSSFKLPGSTLGFGGNPVYLRAPGKTDQDLGTITAAKKDPAPAPKGYLLADQLGKPVRYRLYGFEAEAAPDQSYLAPDSVRLATTLHTAISHASPNDIHLKAGTVAFASTSTQIDPITTGAAGSALGLDGWSLKIDQGMLYGYLTATAGTLKTQTVDVSVKQIHVTPAELKDAQFNLSALSIAGIIPLTLAKPPILGFDQTIAQWFLSSAEVSGPAAYFTGMPGFAPKDTLFLESLSMFSKQTNVALTPSSSQQPILLYGVGSFSPKTIAAFPGQGFVELTSVSFKVPKAPPVSTAIQYYKENGAIKLRVVPTAIKFAGNGIQLAFCDSASMPLILNQKGMSARGIVSEAGKFALTAWLYVTPDSTSIWVETPNTPGLSSPPGWQTLPVGYPKSSLTKVEGGMKPGGANTWGNLWLAGDLTVPTGVEEKQRRLKFDVTGDIVASNQEIGVRNIGTPFGFLELKYEPEKGRLIGKLKNFQKDLGHAQIAGDAEIVVDGQGWYFYGAGDFVLKSPHTKGSAGLIIGDYPTTKDLRDQFKAYSYVYKQRGTLPASFPNALSGFFFEGMGSLPIQSLIGLPDIDIDLGIVSARLWVNAGADFRTGMSFSPQAKTFSVGSDLFIDAGFSLAAWFIVDCHKIGMGLVTDIGYDGSIATNGDWYMEMLSEITISGYVKTGIGICDSDCEGKLCDESHWSGSKTFGIKGHMGNDGNYIDFYSK